METSWRFHVCLLYRHQHVILNFWTYRLSPLFNYEWASDCCLMPKWAIFQLYHDENEFTFDEIIMMSGFYMINILSWIFYSASSLKQQSTGKHVALPQNIFLRHPSLFLLHNGEATDTNFTIFGLICAGIEPTIYWHKASMLTIIPPMQLLD